MRDETQSAAPRPATTRWRSSVSGAVMALISLTSPVLACAFHGYQPNPTLVDVVFGTQDVIYARPTAPNAATYLPLQRLKGAPLADSAVPVDRSVGAPLRTQAGQTVLLARDGAYGPWLELITVDAGLAAVVDDVVARETKWLYGGDMARLRYFAGVLNDPSPQVRRLALFELDRVPYDQLRRLRLPRLPSLAQDMQGGDADLRPIRVLLAGLSGQRQMRPVLQRGLEQAIARDLPYLGAYATALIELDGRAGVSVITQRLAQDSNLPATTQERLLEALAIQAKSGTGALRRTISKEVAALARTSPALAEIAARQFGTLSRWNPRGASGQGAQGTDR